MSVNWVLIVVLAILFICAVHGGKVGLVRTIFATFSVIVAIIVTLLVSPKVAEWIQANEKITGYLSEKVDGIMDFEKFGETISNTIADQISFIEDLPLPEQIKNVILDNNNEETYVQVAAGDFQEYVVNYLTGIIINGVAFVGVFLIMCVGLAVLAKAFDLISKLPLLNSMNKLAGAAVGVIRGLIIVWIAFVLITVFSGHEFGQLALGKIVENKFLSFLYDNNLIMKFITDIGKIKF